jgi:hypothetical protein
MIQQPEFINPKLTSLFGNLSHDSATRTDNSKLKLMIWQTPLAIRNPGTQFNNNRNNKVVAPSPPPPTATPCRKSCTLTLGRSCQENALHPVAANTVNITTTSTTSPTNTKNNNSTNGNDNNSTPNLATIHQQPRRQHKHRHQPTPHTIIMTCTLPKLTTPINPRNTQSHTNNNKIHQHNTPRPRPQP